MEPDYIVQVPSAVEGRKGYDIGVAYVNKRGSITIYLSAYPLNNKVFLIPTKEKNE